MRNPHQSFVLCTASQTIGGDFAKFCGLLRIYELYTACSELGFHVHSTGNSMNYPLSYCELVDARISASEKDLPVTGTLCQSSKM